VTNSEQLAAAFEAAIETFGRLDIVVNAAGPMAEAPVYSAAKAGVVGFTRALGGLAADSGIRVNAVCPELVDTPMALGMGEDVLADLREAGTILAPEDVATCVIQLIEDDTRAGAILRITCADGATYVD
jgi:NAD(P)-dependent dehydrogenase (short-subunit alcohol dehydrogenase family)